jgi:hypothetical protein
MIVLYNMERKFISRHIVGTRNPYATRLIGFRGGMTRRLLQSNDELRGT